MMRQTTLLFLLCAAALSLSLFTLKYQVQDLDDELTRIDQQAIADERAIHVLQAEWSHLNNPARLRALSERHLGLQRISGRQIGSVEQVPLREDADEEEAAPDEELDWEPISLRVGEVRR